MSRNKKVKVYKPFEPWVPRCMDYDIEAALNTLCPKWKDILTNKYAHYRTFTIPKRDGSKRLITAPDKEMKEIQKVILTLFEQKGRAFPSKWAHGFAKFKSPVTNAREHKGAQIVLIMDIKDFFPSITYEMIEKQYGGLAAQFCTFHGRAGQGMPTSPWIGNVLLLPMDNAIAHWCEMHSPQLIYTRYADDITISSKEYCNMKRVKRSVRKLIKRAGFDIKPEKTRILQPHVKMSITGIVINNGEHVSREFRRNLRSEINHYRRSPDPGIRNQIRGKIAWVMAANREQGKKLMALMEEEKKEQK